MSDVFLRIIPADPSFVPDLASENECAIFLDELFGEGEAQIEQYPEVVFIDQGSNFESVSCNRCKQQLDIEYWQEQMDAAMRQQFNNLEISVPCCGSTTSLNSLDYKLPAGFAKYCISIMNPGVELGPESLQELEIILKTHLRVIWALY